jgi:hypothetical protein
MKLSKKYPILGFAARAKSKLGIDKHDAMLRGSIIFLEKEKKAIRNGFDFTNIFIGNIGRAKWYEPCKSLFVDARESYDKLKTLKINSGFYILTGASGVVNSSRVIAVKVFDDGEILCAAYESSTAGLIPDVVIKGRNGESEVNYWMVERRERGKEDSDNYASAIIVSAKAILLFAQHCGKEAKDMMTASVPKKRTTLRKVVNDLGIKRIRLTASWYRDTIQGHPFMVSGHWRKQRHGKGLEKVKAKFITPYMKDGYRSKPLRNAND